MKKMDKKGSQNTIMTAFSRISENKSTMMLIISILTILIMTLMLQGIPRFKGTKIFDSLVTISLVSEFIEFVTIFIPHILLLILLAILFRRFFDHPKLEKISSKTRLGLFFVIIFLLTMIYSFQFITTPTPFIISKHEWRVEPATTIQQVILGNEKIPIKSSSTITFSIKRPVTKMNENGQITLNPYVGNESGTIQIDSFRIETNDTQIATTFGLVIGNLPMGFIVKPSWKQIITQLAEVEPNIKINESVIFPSIPRADFLGGNVTRVIIFSSYNEGGSQNVTLAYDMASGVLTYAFIKNNDSILALILTTSSDINGFIPVPSSTETNSTTSITSNLNTTINQSIINKSNSLVTELPLNYQPLKDFIMLVFLLVLPLLLAAFVAYQFYRSGKATRNEKLNDFDEELDMWKNADKINELPIRKRIIIRYRLANQMLEEIGAPKKESLTPSEFERVIQETFEENISDIFITLSNCFKTAKFEEESRLSSPQLEELERISLKAYEQIKLIYQQKLKEGLDQGNPQPTSSNHK